MRLTCDREPGDALGGQNSGQAATQRRCPPASGALLISASSIAQSLECDRTLQLLTATAGRAAETRCAPSLRPSAQNLRGFAPPPTARLDMLLPLHPDHSTRTRSISTSSGLSCVYPTQQHQTDTQRCDAFLAASANIVHTELHPLHLPYTHS